MNSDDESYDDLVKRSPMAEDVKALAEAAEALTAALKGTARWVSVEANVLIVSRDAYVLGELWWDGESEVYRADIKRYGESW